MTRRTVLVVEDFEDNLAILRDLLTHAGYDVVEAADGEAGVSKARAIRPDLIVMDLQLPVLDGYEATRLIRRQAGLGAVPIIAVTSFALPGDEEKARGAGCDHYVTKPFSPRELLATIRNFLGEGASGGP